MPRGRRGGEESGLSRASPSSPHQAAPCSQRGADPRARTPCTRAPASRSGSEGPKYEGAPEQNPDPPRRLGGLRARSDSAPTGSGGSMPAPPLAAPLLRALLARLLPLARKRLLPPLRRLGRRLRSRESRQALLTCLLCLLNLRKKVDD